MELINVKDLITELKRQGIDLGKGNPYNRLRYYTKIGWIDHMVRKKDNDGIVVGHYPSLVIEKIIEIENLKKEGKSNEEITKFLNEKKDIKKNNSKNYLDTIKSKIGINTILIFLIIFGFIFELYNYNSLDDKFPLNKSQSNIPSIDYKIQDRGRNMIQSGKNKIFINSKSITEKSTVIISFENNIEPATNYFIREKILEEGFTLETNLPINKDVYFNWIIIN